MAMARIKTRVPIAIGVVAVAALTAAGIAWWLSVGVSPAVSAQETVESACNQLEQAESYDFTVRVTDSGSEGTLLIAVRVSGDDYEASWTIQGETTPIMEFVKVGGVSYRRDNSDGQGWQVMGTELNEVSLLFPGVGDSLICPETSRFSYLGAKTLNNFSVKHYTDGNGSSTLDNELSPTGSANNNSLGINEFWIDNSGQIVQHLRTIMPGDTTTGGLPQTSTTQMRTVFADVGETNTITAPVVP